MTSATNVQEIKPLESPKFDRQGQIQERIDDFSLKLMPGRPNIDQVNLFSFNYSVCVVLVIIMEIIF